ncbi:phosphatidylcholine/phosphatidylserine synthase, partial [Pseudomonas aeruginosa]
IVLADLGITLVHYASHRSMPLNIAVTFVWLISSGLLIVQQPADLPILLGLWFAASAYFVGICLWRSAREWFG